MRPRRHPWADVLHDCWLLAKLLAKLLAWVLWSECLLLARQVWARIRRK